MNRLLTLTNGQAMVVTDLHGDWELYRRYRDHFLKLNRKGEMDYLIFMGDLIHSEGPPEQDKSLEIILDILQLRETLGAHVITLLGNHEMPHLYGITLQKGHVTYTPSFEKAMGENRAKVIAFFDGLPFFIRTQAGVSLAHAGATQSLQNTDNAQKLFSFSHQELWSKASELLPPEERPSLRIGFARLNRASYDEMAKELLAITDPNDWRYDDLLISAMVQGFPDFEMLWETLFNKNELEYGEDHYARILTASLKAFSQDFTPQKVLVSGHIFCPDGYQIVAEKQLRVASGIHAKTYPSARYLIFDAGKPIETVYDLIPNIRSIFTP